MLLHTRHTKRGRERYVMLSPETSRHATRVLEDFAAQKDRSCFQDPHGQKSHLHPPSLSLFRSESSRAVNQPQYRR